MEPAKIRGREISHPALQPQTKSDDAKKEVKKELQVKQELVPPKQLKEQLVPKIPAAKEQTSIKSRYSYEQTNTTAEKVEHIKKDWSPVAKLEEKPSIAKHGTTTEKGNLKEAIPIAISKKQIKGNTEKKENPKEEFSPEQTPIPPKQIAAKTTPKGRFIEKHATSHLTKDSIKGEPKKEVANSKDIAAVAPIESDGIYTIQVASYKKENYAKNFAEDLKSKGYPGFIIQAGSRKRKLV